MRSLALALALTLTSCGSPSEAPSPPAPSAAQAPQAAAPVAPAREAPSAPATQTQAETPPQAASDPRVLDDCLWYADPSPPPLEGPGSMTELDERIGARLSRPVRVVGRLRLRARGCPRISAGLVMVASDAEDATLTIIGDDPSRPPVAGARGDERRDRPWAESGALADDDSDCVEPSALRLFRATHAASGEVEAIELEELGEACTLFAHDLQHGDLDGDGTTEIRIEARTSTLMDMSAGAERRDTLWIYDLAELRRQVSLEIGALEAAEVDGYGGRFTSGEIALRDLDGDGDRDIVLRRRTDGSYRSADDMDEEHYREWTSEAYEYDASRDEHRRAPSLDARIAR